MVEQIVVKGVCFMSQGKIYRIHFHPAAGNVPFFICNSVSPLYNFFLFYYFMKRALAVHYRLLPESIKHGTVKLQNKGQKLCRIQYVQLISPLRISGN